MIRIGTVFLLLLLAGCSNAGPAALDHPSPDQKLFQARDGLSIGLAEDLFEHPPDRLEILMENKSPKDVGYGEYIYIEVKKEGEWFALTHSDAVFLKDPSMKDFGLELESSEQTVQHFSIAALGIKLPPGEYRLVKTFLSLEVPVQETSLAVSFRVE